MFKGAEEGPKRNVDISLVLEDFASKCCIFYYLYKHYLKGIAGIGTGVVTGCLYSERLVIHILYNLYNINGKMRELLNPVPLSF